MKYLITESKLKTLIKDKFNIDLTGRVEIDPDLIDVMMSFDNCITDDGLRRRLSMDYYGPLYLIKLDNSYNILYQMNYITDIPWIINNGCDRYDDSEFMELFGISGLGISVEQFLNLYV